MPILIFTISLARSFSLPPSLFFLSRKYLFNYRVDKGAQHKSNRSMQQIILPTRKALTVGQTVGQGDWGTGEGATKGMQIITISYLIKFLKCQRIGGQQDPHTLALCHALSRGNYY